MTETTAPSASAAKPASERADKSKVCRALFGPVDHRLTKQFLRHELTEILIKSNRKWDFDFSRDVPLRNGLKFSWEPTESRSEHQPPKKWSEDRKSRRRNSVHKTETRKQSKCLSLLQSTIKDYMAVEKSSVRKTNRKVLQEHRNKLNRKSLSSYSKSRSYTDKLRRK